MTQVTIITVGSRGDVQPYVALGKGLKTTGYRVRIIATDDFENLVTEAGLEYVSSGANVQNILQGEAWKDRIEGGNFIAIQMQMRQELTKLAPAISSRVIAGTEGSDVIIGGMGAMAGGFSIAEKLNIPIINAHVFPTTPSRQISSPIMPNLPFGDLLNRPAMMLSRQILWHSTRTFDVHVRESLDLPKASFWGHFKQADQHNIPTVYGYSRHVLPKPTDWTDHHHVVGYWFLDMDEDWQPPHDLLDFLDAGEPPIYIGFGSMRSNDAEQAGQMALEALEKAGQRGVLAAGWGGMTQNDLPDNVYMLASIPHSWLFPRMKAVVHHGGAGTTAAGLRAGVPTIITPFFADQPFWGKLVYELGVGAKPMPRKQLTSAALGDAIRQVATDSSIQQKATELGQNIRGEDSITPVSQLIEDMMTRARVPEHHPVERTS